MNSNSKNMKIIEKEILYYFKEMGVLLYGEYMLKEYENDTNFISALLDNYSIFLEDSTNNYSKINHTICYLFYGKKNKEPDCDKKIKYILSNLLSKLKINYFNFILLCNLIHYYNTYFIIIINEDEISFLLLKLKKFFSELIINSEKLIEDKDDNLIITYLFFYYYSILLFRLFKNKVFKAQIESNAENFLSYLEERIKQIFEYEQKTHYKFLYQSEYININFYELINYGDYHNQKLSIYISFIKYFLNIINNNYKKAKDYFLNYYEDSTLTNDIKLGLLSRKLLTIILNYEEEGIEDELLNIEDILTKISKDAITNDENNINENNININNENNNNFNNINNMNDNNNNIIKDNNNDKVEENVNNSENNIIGSNNNINTVEKNENIIKENNSINNKNNTTNNCIIKKTDRISNIINHIKASVESNKDLLKNESENPIRNEYKLSQEMTILPDNNNSNNKTKENKNENENENKTKIFSDIIERHNQIMILTDELINFSGCSCSGKSKTVVLEMEREKNNKRKEINNNCTEFYKYLTKLSNRDKTYIKEYNYLKILITRVFYNYLELSFIDVKRGINTAENFPEQYEKFKKIVNEFDIKNNLVNKIDADYYFVSNAKKEAEKYYNDYINKDSKKSPAGLFGHAVCLYVNNEREYNKKSINQLKNAIQLIEQKIQIKNYQSIHSKLNNLYQQLLK